MAESKAAAISLANDFYDSCVRSIAWDRGSSFIAGPVGNGVATKAKKPKPGRAVTPADYPLVIETAKKIVAETTSKDTFAVGNRCSAHHDAAQQWSVANAILYNYVAALGNLAGDGTSDFGISNLADAVNNIPTGSSKGIFTNDSEKSVFVNSANSLIAFFFDARRRNALGDDIPKYNVDIQTMTKQLASVAVDDYVLQLEQERRFMRRFFIINTAAIPVGLGRLQALQFATNQLVEDQKIDQREAAAEAYRTIVKKIASANSDMATAVSKNDLRSAIAIAHGYAEQLKPQIALLQKLSV